MSSEIFKPIPGYPGYLCSNLGRIFSRKQGFNNFRKLHLDRNGYQQIHLYKNKKRNTLKVHRLVMLTFCGKKSLSVNHIDGNKKNNALENLEYCTVAENNKHARDLGLSKAPKGVNHGMVKLTEREVLSILNDNRQQKVIANLYGVDQSLISRIKSGELWTHLRGRES